MTPPVKKTIVCPACGMEAKGTEKACPSCGWEFSGMDKFECPVCGELIPISSRKCPHCDADLSRLSKKARSQSVDKIREVLMTDLREIESLEETWKEERKFRCPKCAALLDGTESKCPGCGQVLVGKSGLRCPNCATPVGKKRKKCPKCGEALGDLSKEALRMIPVVPEPLAEPVTEQAAVPETRPCPVCEAVIPKDSRRCPKCDADLTEKRPKVRVVKAPGPAKVQAEQAVVLPQPEITRAEEAPVARAETAPRPKRKLKAEKVTTIDLGAKPGARGLSNGLGQINGRGRVNGAGAVNGRSFVNGTGISNGLGPRPRERAVERTSFLTRLQVLALFVAILVIVSAFVFLSFPSETGQFSVDGDFAEWDSLSKYGLRIQSTAPSSNITEWKVATQESDLFLYFQTQEQMMSTSVAESYYLFVDSDGSYSTGYVMGSIGADYMLELTGWDGEVNSTSLYQYSSSSDQFDWNAWSSSGSLAYSADGTRVEAKAGLPAAIGSSAKFMLMSKDSIERGSVSYIAPLEGAVLVVEQIPSNEITLNGIIPKAYSVAALTVRFTSEGGGGHIAEVEPYVIGASLLGQIPSFTLEKGETREVTINLDTSGAQDGRFVSVELLGESIVSSYACVELIGSGIRAHVGAPPSKIAIDGAFADWTGLLTVDQDSIPVTVPSVDITEVGNSSSSVVSFFYVSVEGEMCSGTYVPAAVAKPAGGGGGGGPVIPTRHSAEDILQIYVDYDKSNSTGEWVTYDSKEIGADKLIEVRGLLGRITSMKGFDHSSPGKWEETSETVYAAKDSHRIEIGVTAASLGGSSDIDFIVETTSWKGKGDLATFDPSSTKALTKSWVVDSLTTSRYATSMSYQRKLFYDGVNYWSFFFNGKDTVYKYSLDEGKTWVYSGRVFITPGVNETSIWYDSSTSMVYAVGDTSSPSRNITIQMGIVDAPAHKISWTDKDSNLTTSLNPMAGKNTYISKDSNGYLWVLSSNWTRVQPSQHGLGAFRSEAVNSTASWIDTCGMLLPYGVLPWGLYDDNSKGSIVPAGSGSDMWAIYTYAGYVSAKKYHDGAWPEDYDEVVIYDAKSGSSTANTENSPPSVVVDDKGVVHVVYGTGRADKTKRSIPQIFYSHNNTNSITFTAGMNLDPSNDTSGIANYFPTISLDSSTGNLFVFWIQSDTALVPKTLMGRKCVTGMWSDIPMGPQTTFTKQFMTSIYSVSGEQKICWQWTQNTTALDVEVIFDKIPEFGDLTLPVFGLIVVFAVYRHRSRRKDERTD